MTRVVFLNSFSNPAAISEYIRRNKSALHDFSSALGYIDGCKAAYSCSQQFQNPAPRSSVDYLAPDIYLFIVFKELKHSKNTAPSSKIFCVHIVTFILYEQQWVKSTFFMGCIIRRQSTGLGFLFCGDFLFSTELSCTLQRFFLFGDFSINIFTHFAFAEIFLIWAKQESHVCLLDVPRIVMMEISAPLTPLDFLTPPTEMSRAIFTLRARI